MDQGIVPSQLPLHPDYAQSDEQEAFETYPTQSHHHAQYANAGPVDLRRDVPLHEDLRPNPFDYSNSSTPRLLLPSTGLNNDPTSYRPAPHGLGDPLPSTISPLTSSPETTLPYSYTHNTHYTTTLPPFPNSSAHQVYLTHPTHVAQRLPSVPDGLPHGMSRLPLQRAPFNPSGSFSREPTSYAPLESRQLSASAFGTYAETPRTTPSLRGPNSLPSQLQTAFSEPVSYPQRNEESSVMFPFPALEIDKSIKDPRGFDVQIDIHVHIDKGFFRALYDGKWTCYRRNYFGAHCYFTIHGDPLQVPMPLNSQLSLEHDGRMRNIVAFGLRLVACVDGANGKNIELVQHTPKRDGGPKTKLGIIKLSPNDGSQEGTNAMYSSQPGLASYPPTTIGSNQFFLPLQTEPDPPPELATSSTAHGHAAPTASTAANNNNGQPTGLLQKHLFERIQFKQATANNGKRRASQQFFYLVLELHADIREDLRGPAQWIRIGGRYSDKIVVRGRSPSHYFNEGVGSNGRTSGGGAGGSSGAAAGHSASPASNYALAGGASYGNLTSTGHRGMHTGFGGGPSDTYGLYGRGGNLGYLPDIPEQQLSPVNVSGAAHPNDGTMGPSLVPVEPNGIPNENGYNYFPSAIYEQSTSPLQHPPPHPQQQQPSQSQAQPQLPMPKVEQGPRMSTEPRQYHAVPGPQWQQNPLERFQPTDTSKDYFPFANSIP